MPPPVVPRNNNPQSPVSPVVPIQDTYPTVPSPVVPSPELPYQPPVQPQSDSQSPLQPYQQYLMVFQPPTQSQEYQPLAIKYVPYRGHVYINGEPAPVGTTITTNTGGSTMVTTPGQYSLDAHDVANIEFYVNGYMASPQVRMYTPYKKNIDLYVVLTGSVSARRQVYRNKSSKRGKLNTSRRKLTIRKPKNKWFMI